MITLEFTLDEIKTIAQKVLENLEHKIVVFNGQMGVGKTTFITALCQQIGVNSIMSSPTFSLVNEYHTTNHQTIYHFDVYRLKNEEEALDMGIEEYFYSGNWCFIEWAEKIPNLLPLHYNIIDLTQTVEGKRILKLSTN
ncbi:tRNA (adenosine(37)-N6)-threonylcarbamoyltransferase complex ATPase subunit type 1 TsaE [Flavobacterium croceum]|uniref:tRNA threonylcarbamoyladenosine biosynthesis protein TsaE n=1 Tax=Flavobacterium croceum DSM 17960 TaxID=1121886 RepID=A0A2S4NAR0_9FLAO|nr:tRNA (adenosine(37)-N6)-threonylcarbamoyltransferase complex ATPase subunit type 1 TsaE [Flavobacterium croceum]POS02789.1 tRNA threonylcarbamoyladenosine biosynthesis protein TsaE [Flavobacterium croceum DSM 17960]